MYAKEDFLNYFRQIRDYEAAVAKEIDNLLEQVDDQMIFPMLEEIRSDNQKHVDIINTILDCISQKGCKGPER